MRGFTFLPVVAAFAVLAAARYHHTENNVTHFIHQQTGKITQRFGCDVGIHQASDHFKKTIKRLHEEHQYSNVGTRAALPIAVQKIKAAKTPKLSIHVPTYFHIISTAAHNGTITPAMVSAQIKEMNTAYNPYGISFTLAGTTWTTNDAWAIAAGSDMAAAQAALRKGTYSTLNIYFHTDLSGGNLGTCTLPSQLPPGAATSVYINDGCDVNANTMPGGTMQGYNLGKTAVHETGHWLGLLHTFEGYACTGNGDYVSDTKIEEQSTDGCPTSPAKNTCPSVAGGADPIHNYMDYSTDACYEQFTAGQIARIGQLYGEYRKGN